MVSLNHCFSWKIKQHALKGVCAYEEILTEHACSSNIFLHPTLVLLIEGVNTLYFHRLGGRSENSTLNIACDLLTIFFDVLVPRVVLIVIEIF